MTVYHRGVEYGLLDECTRYLSETELTRLIEDLQAELPDIGETLVAGRIQSMGYREFQDAGYMKL